MRTSHRTRLSFPPETQTRTRSRGERSENFRTPSSPCRRKNTKKQSGQKAEWWLGRSTAAAALLHRLHFTGYPPETTEMMSTVSPSSTRWSFLSSLFPCVTRTVVGRTPAAAKMSRTLFGPGISSSFFFCGMRTRIIPAFPFRGRFSHHSRQPLSAPISAPISVEERHGRGEDGDHLIPGQGGVPIPLPSRTFFFFI